MARKLPLRPERLDWKPSDPEETRRPINCVLAGGKVEYGNVRKLPNLLWKEFGVVVTKHIAGVSPAPETSPDFDLAIGLVDQSSHGLMEWAKSASEQVIYCPSTWSRIKLALQEVGIEPFPGRSFRPPPAPPPEVLPKLTPATFDGPSKPAPRQPPQTPPAEKEVLVTAEQKKEEGMPREVKDLLVKLKRAMSKANLEKLELVLHEDELSVEYRRVVVQNGLEVL